MIRRSIEALLLECAGEAINMTLFWGRLHIDLLQRAFSSVPMSCATLEVASLVDGSRCLASDIILVRGEGRR